VRDQQQPLGQPLSGVSDPLALCFARQGHLFWLLVIAGELDFQNQNPAASFHQQINFTKRDAAASA